MGYQKKLTLSIALALGIGLGSMLPTASALPAGLTSDTATQTTNGKTMTVTGTATNNLLNWTSFSIAKGETVNFANKNNYMNIVTGNEASQIFGNMTGGGTVYLINPNGILFGSSSSVNVGNLVASTRTITDAQKTAFTTNGTNPILTTTVETVGGDITNLGSIKASSVVIEGCNIILKSTSDITNSDGKMLSEGRDTKSDDQSVGNVTIKAAGIIKVGYEDTKTANKTNNNQTTYAKYDSSNTARKLGYIMSDLKGYTVKAANTDHSAANKELQSQATKLLNDGAYQEYMLVHNATELQTLADSATTTTTTADDGTQTSTTSIAGNYFLTNDIDASSIANFTPIGTSAANFQGDFNGLGYTINGLTETTSAAKSPAGLFGTIGTSGVVENLTLTNVSITDTNKNNVGAVAGINNGTIMNVTVGAASGDTSKITGTVGEGAVGGVVGDNRGTVTNAVNYASVVNGKRIGGVVGINEKNGTLLQVTNAGTLSGRSGEKGAGGVVGQNQGMITDASNTGNLLYSPKDATKSHGSIAGTNTGTITYIKAEGTASQTSDDKGLTADASATGTALSVTGDGSEATQSTNASATGNSLFNYTAKVVDTGSDTKTDTGDTGSDTKTDTGDTGSDTKTDTGDTGSGTKTDTGDTGSDTKTDTDAQKAAEEAARSAAQKAAEQKAAITATSQQAASANANQQRATRTEDNNTRSVLPAPDSTKELGQLADGSRVIVLTGSVLNVDESSAQTAPSASSDATETSKEKATA